MFPTSFRNVLASFRTVEYYLSITMTIIILKKSYWNSWGRVGGTHCFALNVSYFLQRSWLASHANGEFPVLRKRHSNKPRQGNTKLHTNRLVTTCSLEISKRERFKISSRHSFGHMETLALIISAIEGKCFNVWHGLAYIIFLGTISDWFREEQRMEILVKVLCKQTLRNHLPPSFFWFEF